VRRDNKLRVPDTIFSFHYFIIKIQASTFTPSLSAVTYTMGKTRTSRKQDEGADIVIYETDWSANSTSDNVHHDGTGLTYFKQTNANLLKVAADPEKYQWVREYGNRHILCWKVPGSNVHKDIQLIVIGEIRSATLDMPNTYGAYTVDVELDDDCRRAFDQIWKSSELGHDTDINIPVNDLGIARFTAKVDAINKDARKKKMNTVLKENDPFPGLHDGSIMDRKSTDLVPRHVADFVTGAIVAIEATVATYDFTGSDGSHRSGYSLGLREVYWLREDEDRGNPATPSKKRQAEVELISPRSYARQKKVATFDD
jgi:hypothetical protein